MLKCAQCLEGCEDKTEFSALKTEQGWLAVHGRCVEALVERIRALKPYETLEVPPECRMGGDGWQSTAR